MIILYILVALAIVLLLVLIFLVTKRAKDGKGESFGADDLAQLKVLEAKCADLTAEISLKNQQIFDLQNQNMEDAKSITRLEAQIEANKLLSEDMVNSFKAISQDVTSKSSEAFLKLAEENFKSRDVSNKSELEKRHKSIEELLNPIRESLKDFDGKVNELEKHRQSAYDLLTKQVEDMKNSEKELTSETRKLVTALRAPKARGQWGEMQLKNAVLRAGLSEYTDFSTEVSSIDDEGKRQRPDMIVNLPNGRKVIIDAKTPIDAYLNMLDSTDEAGKEQALKSHVEQIKTQINNLGNKKYYEAYVNSSDFVILFLPMESIFSDALSVDNGLLEYAAEKKVIISTPTTLIAILFNVSKIWQEQTLIEEMEAVRKEGSALYDRLMTFTNHLFGLGKSITGVVTDYNKSIGSLESMVMPSARRFKALKMTDKELVELKEVDISARELKIRSEKDDLTAEEEIEEEIADEETIDADVEDES